MNYDLCSGTCLKKSGIYSVAMFQKVKHFRCRGLNAYGIKCFWTFYPLYFTGQTKYDNSNFGGCRDSNPTFPFRSEFPNETPFVRYCIEHRRWGTFYTITHAILCQFAAFLGGFCYFARVSMPMYVIPPISREF